MPTHSVKRAFNHRLALRAALLALALSSLIVIGAASIADESQVTQASESPRSIAVTETAIRSAAPLETQGDSPASGQADGWNERQAGSDNGAAAQAAVPGEEDQNDAESTFAAVDRIEVRLDAPQNYDAAVDVLGWRNLKAGIAVVRVRSADLLGPIDPISGQSRAAPGDDEPDNSPRFADLVVLAAVSSGSRPGLEAGSSANVRLVLMPTADSATFFIERVEQP